MLMRLGDRGGGGSRSRQAQRLHASGFSSLRPCLSAGGKQEASDDREGKELRDLSQRPGH